MGLSASMWLHGFLAASQVASWVPGSGCLRFDRSPSEHPTGLVGVR